MVHHKKEEAGTRSFNPGSIIIIGGSPTFLWISYFIILRSVKLPQRILFKKKGIKILKKKELDDDDDDG